MAVKLNIVRIIRIYFIQSAKKICKIESFMCTGPIIVKKYPVSFIYYYKLKYMLQASRGKNCGHTGETRTCGTEISSIC